MDPTCEQEQQQNMPCQPLNQLRTDLQVFMAEMRSSVTAMLGSDERQWDEIQETRAILNGGGHPEKGHVMRIVMLEAARERQTAAIREFRRTLWKVGGTVAGTVLAALLMFLLWGKTP